jgi:hypothetical protein
VDDISYTDYKPLRRWTEDPRPIAYVVVDLKADGGDVRRNSLRALAAVAIAEQGRRLGDFAATLSPIEDARPDPRTAAFLKDQPAAMRALATSLQRPADAVPAFERFVKSLPGQPVLVAAPLSHASLWLDAWLRRFGGHVLVRTPAEGVGLFAGGGVDLPSLVMGVTGLGYREALPHLLPSEWRAGRNETHDPRQDVEMLAAILISMLSLRAKAAR